MDARTAMARARRLAGSYVLPWLAGAACVVGWLWALPVVADAQTPAPCPDAPAEYTGTDDVVNELRALRVDQRFACLALVERLEANGAKTETLRAQLDADHAEAQAQLELIAQHTDPADDPPVDNGSAAVVDAIDTSQNQLDAALWFLAGLLCSVTAGVLFAREVLTA